MNRQNPRILTGARGVEIKLNIKEHRI